MKKVTLSINPAENRPEHYLVVVNGEGFLDSIGKGVGARIRGEDTFVDDALFPMDSDHVNSSGAFHLSKTVHSSWLDEDLGEDEIYALVDVGGLSGTFKTNTVTGDF